MTISPLVEARCADLAHEPSLTLLLDLDGTLIPFVDRAEDARIDAPLADLVAALQRGGIGVVIVTGRPRGLVEPLRAALPNVPWAAEHGMWRCDERGDWTAARVQAAPTELDDLAASLADSVTTPGARIERKSLSIAAHWRLVDPTTKAAFVAATELACDEWLESHPDFERIAGVEMLEVRYLAANKGSAVAWARERQPHARFIAIGDDETDEDMFAALHEPRDLAIAVGPRRPRRAHLRLHGPADVREFLRWIVAARTEATAPPPRELEVVPEPAAPTTRLLVVSNRVPTATTGRKRAVGGLVSALEPALESSGGIWLGWSGRQADGERPLVVDIDARPARAEFDFSPAWREHFYAGFCNRALWPLFHGFAGRVEYVDADWAAYVEANAEFARHAASLVAPDGVVWVHDYHLLLVARDLRRAGFRGRIGLFLHIPFPGRDLVETVPWVDELLDGMLAFDVVGFHTVRWADNFRAATARLGTHALPEIAVLPIGVDPAAFVPSETPDPEVTRLMATLGSRRMILGVDRLDYSKGIPERMRAFERLLESTPAWRGEVCLVQISVPSREDIPEYASLRAQVETLVGRINGRFGEADWVPVRYLYRSYPHDVLAQLYRAADVALVTPLRDGLNLVAKEFVVAQAPSSPGVLVLSRFAGAADELGDAVLTNPFHPEGVARDLDRALRMAPEMRARHHVAMAAVLEGQTPQRWARAFLDRLERR